MFFALIFRRRLELWFVLLILSPATFLFPFIDESGGGRKEILYFALLAAWCLYLDRHRTVSLFAGITFTIFAAALVLSHDAVIFFFFFSPPRI